MEPFRVEITPHIRYQNPYGGHPILRRKGTDAYAAIRAFLSECTDWDGEWENVEARLDLDGKFIAADARTREIAEHIQRRLGTPSGSITSSELRENDDGQPELVPTSSSPEWNVTRPDFEGLIEQVYSASPAKRGWPDPISCTCSATFQLRESPGGALIAGQASGPDGRIFPGIRSGILAHLSAGNTSAFFDLVLPFDAPDQRLTNYVKGVRKLLPIRLSKGGFRMYLPSKGKHGYVTRRVDAALLADV
jgi:hypothetical protein